MSIVGDDARVLEDGLKSDLEGVSRWVSDNRLKLNVGKTQLLLLGRKRREQVDVTMGGQRVVRKERVKSLD